MWNDLPDLLNNTDSPQKTMVGGSREDKATINLLLNGRIVLCIDRIPALNEDIIRYRVCVLNGLLLLIRLDNHSLELGLVNLDSAI